MSNIRLNKSNYNPNNPHSTSISGPVLSRVEADSVEVKSGKRKGLDLPMEESNTVEAGSLDSIAPVELWHDAIVNGDVNQQTHDEHPYSIVKYSQQTVFSKNWNAVTLAARGLIFNHETFKIVARPFAKFFNYEENMTPKELMWGPFRVAEKLDGSLGTSYLSPDGKFHIASSGSFNSEQATHANQVYASKYEGKWSPNPELTYLFEIIYPENRIVVDYGDTDDLFLLGAVDTGSGKNLPLNEISEWPGPRAEEHEFNSLEELAATPNRENKEGYIVHYVETDTRVKFKHEDYVRMHRYVTGVNSRHIWEMLKNGDKFDDMMFNMPEEFMEYVDRTKKDIQNQFDTQKNTILESYKAFSDKVGDADQKAFAISVQKDAPKALQPYFYILRKDGHLDAPKVSASLWERLKPEFERSLWSNRADS